MRACACMCACVRECVRVWGSWGVEGVDVCVCLSVHRWPLCKPLYDPTQCERQSSVSILFIVISNTIITTVTFIATVSVIINIINVF